MEHALRLNRWQSTGRKRAKGPVYGLGAPIFTGWASPLRVATGGNANWGSEVRCRRSPARENGRREQPFGVKKANEYGLNAVRILMDGKANDFFYPLLDP